MNEMGLAKIKIPQQHWQIPNSWVNFTPLKNMVVWGSILGSGIFTYVPNVLFYLAYLYTGFFYEPYLGIIVGFIYGFGRTFPSFIISARSRKNYSFNKMINGFEKLIAQTNKIILGVLSILFIYCYINFGF
ncbi:hypothetical protein [Alkalibacillus silvisoli]|uniref:hypothetical protein n=1 Tax=Alkalibacillus silvisoli TaxID=392823 RepID=UPI0031D904CA